MRSATRDHSARSGFTLVELLVAIAVLGILLSAIVTLTSSFLGYSRHVSAINERLADLTDAMGYVGLNAKASMKVYGEAGTTRQITFGTTFTCSVDDPAEPCIAFVVPVVNRADGRISGFDFVAYSVRPLSAWTENPGVPAGWDGVATPVLLEYRRRLCTDCGEAPPEAPPTVVATRVSLVIADLFLAVDGGGAIEPFEVTTDSSRITLRLRTRGSGLNDGVRVPSDGPLTQFIVRRP